MGIGLIKPRGQLKLNSALGQFGIFQLKNQPQKNKIQGQQYALETIRVIQSQQIFNEWYDSSLKIINDQNSKMFILYPINHYFTTAGVCGQVKQVNNDRWFFKIFNRRKKQTSFTESQMWYMLFMFVQTGTIFQLKKRNKMGNFHPSKIVINQQGYLKFVSILSIPDQTTNFHRLSGNIQCKDVYLAPQQFNKSDIQKGMYPIQVDPCKADTFSIGMTLLNCALLQDCSNFYQSKQGLWFVNRQDLIQKFTLLTNNYSGLLIKYLKFMLQFDPNSRKKCSQIKSQLKPYESNILQLQPFQQIQNRSRSQIPTNSIVNSGISHSSVRR